MNFIKHHILSGFTATVLVSSALTAFQAPAHAGFWSKARDSVRDELKNCVRGGCDPTRTNPREVIKTGTGYRAIGAATDRWANSQIRISDAKANEVKIRFRKYISSNSSCMEILPAMQGVCTDLNNAYGLNMQIKTRSLRQIASEYISEDIQFLVNCSNQKNIPFVNPTTLSCFPLSSFTE